MPDNFYDTSLCASPKININFYNNCLLSRTLIGSFLANMFIYASFGWCTQFLSVTLSQLTSLIHLVVTTHNSVSHFHTGTVMSEKTTVRLKLDPLIAIRNLRPKQLRVRSYRGCKFATPESTSDPESFIPLPPPSHGKRQKLSYRSGFS